MDIQLMFFHCFLIKIKGFNFSHSYYVPVVEQNQIGFLAVFLAMIKEIKMILHRMKYYENFLI